MFGLPIPWWKEQDPKIKGEGKTLLEIIPSLNPVQDPNHIIKDEGIDIKDFDSAELDIDSENKAEEGLIWCTY